MKFSRRLSATAVPIALLTCAGTAQALSAAPKASFRVEGATKTLLAPKNVTAPSSGSITKGGAPAGVCPADSAAGALDVATHGNWDGTYSSGLGVEVTKILGTTALYAKGSYWEFFVDDHAASAGVCDTRLAAGESLLFAQVPAKGKAELPLVITAPKTVTAGKPFDVKTFVYAGKGNSRTPVKVKLDESFLSYTRTAARNRFASHAGARGTTRLTVNRAGSYTLTASATDEIRSAPITIKVVK